MNDTITAAGGKNSKLSGLLSMVGPFIGLGLIILLFSILEPEKFPTFFNFLTVANQTVIVALAAMGMTYIIISGGIDLSVGSVIALVTVVVARLVDAGVDPLLAAIAGVLAGAVCGMVSGLLIGGMNIIPFIATLGMMGIARGVAKWLSGQQKVDAPMTWLWELMSRSPALKWLIVSPGVWLMIISAGRRNRHAQVLPVRALYFRDRFQRVNRAALRHPGGAHEIPHLRVQRSHDGDGGGDAVLAPDGG